LNALSASAHARILLLLSLLPAFATLLLMTAALAPSFGWIADHCGILGDPHQHPHLCAAHHVAALPALTLSVLALLLVARVLLALLRGTTGLFAALRLRRALDRLASPVAAASARWLPLNEPQAFIVGLIKPVLYATRGLRSSAYREHLQTVLAHERAHVRRRDPLRRFIAGLGVSFHLPFVARAISERLACAQEMAADSEAAALLGSERVARALVKIARSRTSAPTSAMAFGGPYVELRVRRLLDERPRHDFPGPAALAVTFALLVAVVCIGADHVHHGIELLLGLLSG
jgi:Zn-dependent protease with chaperone function